MVEAIIAAVRASKLVLGPLVPAQGNEAPAPPIHTILAFEKTMKCMVAHESVTLSTARAIDKEEEKARPVKRAKIDLMMPTESVGKKQRLVTSFFKR